MQPSSRPAGVHRNDQPVRDKCTPIASADRARGRRVRRRRALVGSVGAANRRPPHKRRRRRRRRSMPRLGKRQAAPFITRSATADARLIFMTTSGTASGTAAAVAAAESWRSACSPCCSSSQRRPARRSTPRGARALPRAYAREHGHHGRERLADLVRLDGAVDGTTVACRRRHCSSCSRFILRATSPGRPHHERHAYAAWGGARALGRTCANTTDRSVHVLLGANLSKFSEV